MMENLNYTKLFHDKQVRVHWDNEAEKWYFSIVDVVQVLTENERPRKYWADLKKKLKNEESQLSEKIGQLKMKPTDGRMRQTDVADRTIIAINSINSLSKGRTIQNVVGKGCL